MFSLENTGSEEGLKWGSDTIVNISEGHEVLLCGEWVASCSGRQELPDRASSAESGKC